MSEKVPARPARPPPPALPEGWVAVWDEEYQRYYFANSINQATQWDVPTVPASVAARPPPPDYHAASPAPVVHVQQALVPQATAQAAYVAAPAPQVQHVQQVPVQQVPVQQVPVQQVPVQQVPVQTVHVVQAVPVKAVPVQAAPARRTGPGLVTGLVVGSMVGRSRSRRRR